MVRMEQHTGTRSGAMVDHHSSCTVPVMLCAVFDHSLRQCVSIHGGSLVNIADIDHGLGGEQLEAEVTQW